MPDVRIAPVDGRRDLRRFVDLPWRLHGDRDDRRWIPPLRRLVRGLLDTRDNPFYRRAERALFLALRDGRPVGRVAAIENRAHNEHHGDRTGFFGFFEAEDDAEAARALMDAAAAWLGERGLRVARGPVSPSTNHQCGLLVEGFGLEPFFMTPWNPPYYEELLLGAGFEPARDLLGYFMSADEERFRVPDRVRRVAERRRRRAGVTFRPLDFSRFHDDVELCRQIYNEAWAENWGFVPMSEDEFAHMADELRPLLIPRFALLAEARGEPAGFMIMVPDFNQVFKRIPSGRLLPFGFLKLLLGKRRLRSGRLMLMGVRERFRGRGLFALFADELRRRVHAWDDPVGAEASWVLEDNRALNGLLADMGLEVTKRWRIYERAVT